VRGETFELGEPLSAAAASNLESALALLEKLCVGPRSLSDLRGQQNITH
jgi:hypothetical protein